ncbi:MAG: LOG family protein [Burkholderiaceae bacterium]|nr:LOG family protein [Burkholderiaceae bacterium]
MQEKWHWLDEYAQTVPYTVFPETLYTRETLLAGYRPQDEAAKAKTYDRRVYRHFLATGKRTSSAEELMLRALHDQAIGAAVDQFLTRFEHKRIVGIMGGHALARTDVMYRKIVLLSKQLTENGYLMVSGGGSGAMEATHLGAWLAGRTNDEVKAALSILDRAPTGDDADWLDTAFEVVNQFPQTSFESLSVPTWLYSHEPSNIFATSIAKFFDNNTREQRLLSMAGGGMIFTPGSAGTLMEVFEEAALNHYATYDGACPMIFFNRPFWTKTTPLYPFLEKLIESGTYKNMKVSVTDDLFEVTRTIDFWQKS